MDQVDGVAAEIAAPDAVAALSNAGDTLSPLGERAIARTPRRFNLSRNDDYLRSVLA